MTANTAPKWWLRWRKLRWHIRYPARWLPILRRRYIGPKGWPW